MHFKEFIGEGKFWGRCLRGKLQEGDLVQLCSWKILLQCAELVLSLGLVLCCLLHLVLAKDTRTGSGVLRSRCLSALQELVGRNGFPLLLSSSFKSRFYYLLIYVLKFISVYEQIMNDYMLCCKLLSLKSLSCFNVESVLWWKIILPVFFPI